MEAGWIGVGVGIGACGVIVPSVLLCCLWVGCCCCCQRCKPVPSPTSRRVDGKMTVLVTGGNGGIGLALAKQFVLDDYNVVIVGRDEKKLQNAKLELERISSSAGYSGGNVRVSYYTCDLSVSQNVYSFVDQLEKDKVVVHVLVNNAGFGVFGDFEEADSKKLESMINCNCNALVLLSRLLLPKMIACGQTGCGILNVASIGGYNPVPKFSVYAATKAFVRSHTFSMRAELSLKYGDRIRVSVLSPGATESSFDAVANSTNTKLAKDKHQTADECAMEGYYGWCRNDREVVSGLTNHLAVKWLFPCIPHSILMKLVASGFEVSK